MIAFTVSYTLKEYLSFVQAHAASEAAKPAQVRLGIVRTTGEKS